jgi:hypothetical protein
MECGICQLECTEPLKFSQNPLIKNWYPDRVGMCSHSFCSDCLQPWLVNCLTEGRDFNCPICRFVYISHDRLYHAYNLAQCVKEYKKRDVNQSTNDKL